MPRPILTRTVAPTKTPVSLEDIKDHCRIDHDDEDTVLSSYLSAATEMLDVKGKLGKAMVTQTWKQSVATPDCLNRVQLVVVPVQSITSITYFDADNASQSLTVGDFDFFKDDDWAYIEPNESTNWPSFFDRPDALSVTYVAGFGEASDVPENVRHAIKLLVGHWFENREAVSVPLREIPLGFDALVENSRIGWYG